MNDSFSITNNTRRTISRVLFFSIKEKILGKRYTLSLVFVGKTHMQRLNRTYRKKNEPTDILAFPLEKNSGEMYIHLGTVAKKAKQFSLTPRHYLAYVFIHGCLHLKGMEHGRTMEKSEDMWCRTFGIPEPTR